MDLIQLYNKKSQFAIRNVGKEKVLVPVRKNIASMTEIYTLNEVGSFIWDKIDGKNTEQDIVNAIVSEFEVDETMAKNDLKEFISKFDSVIS